MDQKLTFTSHNAQPFDIGKRWREIIRQIRSVLNFEKCVISDVKKFMRFSREMMEAVAELPQYYEEIIEEKQRRFSRIVEELEVSNEKLRRSMGIKDEEIRQLKEKIDSISIINMKSVQIEDTDQSQPIHFHNHKNYNKENYPSIVNNSQNSLIMIPSTQNRKSHTSHFISNLQTHKSNSNKIHFDTKIKLFAHTSVQRDNKIIHHSKSSKYENCKKSSIKDNKDKFWENLEKRGLKQKKQQTRKKQ